MVTSDFRPEVEIIGSSSSPTVVGDEDWLVVSVLLIW